MKLAEALIERADLREKLMKLDSRLENNARVQEGEEPGEAPSELLKELDECIKRYEYLIVHINKTNAQTIGKDGVAIADMIAKRDVLMKKLEILSDFVQSGSMLLNRSTRTEIKMLSTFSVTDMQKKIDKLSAEIRKIDTSIQELNWLTELL